MLQGADAYPMNLGFTGKGNASLPEPLIEQVKADGQRLWCEPVEVLTMMQRYFLFCCDRSLLHSTRQQPGQVFTQGM